MLASATWLRHSAGRALALRSVAPGSGCTTWASGPAIRPRTRRRLTMPAFARSVIGEPTTSFPA